MPQLFAFKPQFQPAAIFSFCLVFIVSAVETIGDTTACCKGGLSRDITADEISGSLCVDGFFNELPSFIGDIFAGNMVAGVFVVGLILDLCLPRDPSHYEGMKSSIEKARPAPYLRCGPSLLREGEALRQDGRRRSRVFHPCEGREHLPSNGGHDTIKIS